MDRIDKPTLILDEAIAQRNLQAMVEKCRHHRLRLRPHFKTHQSLAIADWFRSLQINQATVSSLSMARYFQSAGWDDLTVAIPHNVRERLPQPKSTKRMRLNLLLDHPDTVSHLGRLSASQDIPLWIKIDCGAHRCGVEWSDEQAIEGLIRTIKLHPHLHLEGFLTHAGHSYGARNREEVGAVHADQIERMNHVKRVVKSSHSSQFSFSIGDTPSLHCADSFPGIDEVRPGNFIFFDVDQLLRKVCSWHDIAVSVACPVIGVYPKRSQIAIHGGVVHLGKEFRPCNGNPCYGLPVLYGAEGWSEPLAASLSALSQEHGVVTFEKAIPSEIRIGSLIGILPIHSCITADLYPHYITLSGKRIDKWRHMTPIG